MNRDRFIAKSVGDNVNGTRAGLAKLLELLDLEGYKSAAIVVPRIGNVSHTILVDVLGEDLSKELIKKRTIIFDDEKRLNLCADATVKNFRYEDAYLGLWATKDTIAKIEALPTWKGFVVVTWVPTDGEDWATSNNVAVVYDDGKGK